MKTLSRDEGNIQWDDLWSNLTSEWFKVEVLQDYSGEDSSESLIVWMAGDKERSIELMKSEPHAWADECRAKVEAGVTLTRIHIVKYPLSEYLRWEIEAYKNRNIPIGKETVFLLDRKDVEHLKLPDGDIMIFDQSNVATNTYNDSGYVTSQTFYDNTIDDISYFLNLRAELLAAKLVNVSKV